MMAASAADLGDRTRAQGWKLWWFAWRKRIGLGLSADSGCLIHSKHKLARSTIAAILERHGIEIAQMAAETGLLPQNYMRARRRSGPARLRWRSRVATLELLSCSSRSAFEPRR